MIGAFFRTVLALCLALAFAGCSTGSDTATPSTDGSDWTVTPTTPPTKPVRVQIPSLHVDSPIVERGLQPNGEMQVPEDEQDTGWFTKSPIPGQPGPAVLAAHVNWKGKDGPFAHLDQLKPGDEVIVESVEGASITFMVDRVETYPKDAFDHATVYGDTPGPELRLITCGGEFDTGINSYQDNIVAFAHRA